MAHSVNVPAILANIPLFREMTPEDIARIAQDTREQHLMRGNVLFQRGDQPSGFYMVVHGQIKLALSSPQGIEKVVELFGAGQSFGEAVMFMGKPYPVYAQALVDTLVLHVGKQAVLGGIDTDPVFCRKMLAGLSIRLHRMIHYVESFSLRSSAQRVVGYLLQNTEEAAKDRETTISLPANKNIIASNLNITPETFSRILHNLVSEGLIEVTGKDVTIKSITKLRAYDN